MRLLPLIALLLAGSAFAQSSQPSLQNLIANSPFGTATQPVNGGAPGTPLEFRGTPLEFRGTFVDNGERFFSILDPGTRRAEWVSLNEAGRPFTVKNYDPDRETIVVDFQGRSMDLKLHSARVTAMPSAPVAQAPGPQNVPGGGPQVRPSPSTTEAQRLAQVAEEIRRRRALRQQAQQQAAGQQQQPPAPNQPPR